MREVYLFRECILSIYSIMYKMIYQQDLEKDDFHNIKKNVLKKLLFFLSKETMGRKLTNISCSIIMGKTLSMEHPKIKFLTFKHTFTDVLYCYPESQLVNHI